MYAKSVEEANNLKCNQFDFGENFDAKGPLPAPGV